MLWRTYIIDFEYSLVLDHGPGHQGAVKLPDTIHPRPQEGATHFDPYAWDMLGVGRAFEVMLRVSRLSLFAMLSTDFVSFQSIKPHPPWLARWFVQWLIGEERADCMGTVGVCRCRPSAARARRVFGALRWVLYAQDACVRALSCVSAWIWGRSLKL